MGVMGEAGPEAIMPLARDGSGRLGVRGSGANVVVNVIESPGKGGQVNQRQDDSGANIIDVMVEQIEGKVWGNVARGECLGPK
jgi:phage-related minor tail protein